MTRFAYLNSLCTIKKLRFSATNSQRQVLNIYVKLTLNFIKYASYITWNHPIPSFFLLTPISVRALNSLVLKWFKRQKYRISGRKDKRLSNDVRGLTSEVSNQIQKYYMDYIFISIIFADNNNWYYWRSISQWENDILIIVVLFCHSFTALEDVYLKTDFCINNLRHWFFLLRRLWRLRAG